MESINGRHEQTGPGAKQSQRHGIWMDMKVMKLWVPMSNRVERMVASMLKDKGQI